MILLLPNCINPVCYFGPISFVDSRNLLHVGQLFFLITLPRQSCQVEVVEFLESFPSSQKPTRFGGGGGGEAAIFCDPHLARSQLFTPHSVIFVSRDTHFGQIRQKSRFLAEK